MFKAEPTSRLNIAFTDERWQHVVQEWEKFWSVKLDGNCASGKAL